jgi:proteasome lid subunit RPN8/RPN11
MKLQLRREQLEAIDKHALKNFPRECCGLLLGKLVGDFIKVEEVAEAENVLGSAVTFEIDSEFVFKVIDRAEESGRELIGIYHSHPNVPAYISSSDNEIMRLWPGVAWLVLSVTSQRVEERKVYAMVKGKILELKIEVA